jgi:selenocysteine lyase/cysteine desulfurase
MDRVEAVRESLARLIGAKFNEMAFIENTSQGLNVIANGLAWQPGDVIVVTCPDFPATLYPWLNLERLGVHVRYLQRHEGTISVADAAESICHRTKLLVVSSVDYATGFTIDLKELGALCHDQGILFCVDAIQSLGLLPLDVKKCRIHFMSAGGYKWLLGPMGTGCLYIDETVSHLLHPSSAGWKSVTTPEDFTLHFTLKKEADRFESGNLNVPGIFGLGASVDLLLSIGISRIGQRVLTLTDKIIQGLQQRNISPRPSFEPWERSGIMTFIPPNAPETCAQFLAKQGVSISLRHGRIRLSPHFYNTTEDIVHFFNILDQYLKLI